MAGLAYKAALVGISGVIVLGACLAVYGYHADIYPLDRMRGHLDGIAGSSDPVMIGVHIAAIQADLDVILEKLPERTNSVGMPTKNPVWIFSTESTNFLRIQSDVDALADSVSRVSAVPKDSSAYHTGMMDVSSRAQLLRTNVMDATPYMYVSITNIVSSVIWAGIIFGIFAAIKRKKEKLVDSDESRV